MLDKKRRAISPYVSVILLTIIVMIAGAIIYHYSVLAVDSYYKRIMEKEASMLMQVSRELGMNILSSFIDNNDNVVIIVATGKLEITIDAIYLNNTPATNCLVYLSNGTSYSELVIPPASVAAIVCPTAPITNSVEVKIIHGEVQKVAVANRI